MPLKLPKGFQRRKTSGNALEEVQNPPGQSTFRVFERSGAGGKSFEAGRALRPLTESKPLPSPKRSYEEDDDLFSNRNSELAERYEQRSISSPALAINYSESGGTNNSGSTALNDSASVSTRMSNTSTNASSTSIRSVQKSTILTDRPYDDIPLPPRPKPNLGFPHSARDGPPFNNGLQSGSNNTSAPLMPLPHANYADKPLPDVSDRGRERSVTASSASTATPPRIFDSDLTLNSSELDGFGNMFDNIGRHSNVPRLPDVFPNQSSSPTPDHNIIRQQSSAIPPPLNAEEECDTESFPYSWRGSGGLQHLPGPAKATAHQDMPSKMISRKTLVPQALQEKTTPDEQGLYESQNSKSPSPLGRGLSAPPSPLERSDSSQNLLSDQPLSAEYAMSHKLRQSFDSSFAAEADLAAKWQERPLAPAALKSNNKIMTPAQFERYRKQQERDQKLAAPSGTHQEDSDSDHYDDDDEAERDRQAVRQRRKQEARLTVYRQTMMKVTGEQAHPRSASSLGARMSNLSPTDPTLRMSHLTVNSKTSSKSNDEEEEDDDVPLGILAAHGFPNKHRPPTRLTSASSPSVLTLTQPQAPLVAGSTIEARRGSLPVFARKLPQDPYFGAGVVNSPQRESMGMGGGSALGVPMSPNMQPYPVHPAGLVGIIAGEEKSRQMRRGSPNVHGGYDMPPQPGMPRSHTMGSLGYPEMVGMPPALTPGEMQMNQQMAQMMQMQQQFMQQMQQMMGSQAASSSPMLPPIRQQSPGSMLMPPDQIQRPHSMPMPPAPGLPGRRSMSTLNSGMMNWNQRPNSYFPRTNGNGGPGYAASLTPSERSNIGLAPRYRPVTTASQENENWKRSSTFTTGTVRPVLSGNGPVPSTIAVDDEDDDEGWKEMKAKRDNKKSKWNLKKAQTGLSDLLTNGSAL